MTISLFYLHNTFASFGFAKIIIVLEKQMFVIYNMLHSKLFTHTPLALAYALAFLKIIIFFPFLFQIISDFPLEILVVNLFELLHIIDRQIADRVKGVNFSRLQVFADLQMILPLVFAQFEHIAEYGNPPAPSFEIAQHIDRRFHGYGIGVIAIVYKSHAGGGKNLRAQMVWFHSVKRLDQFLRGDSHHRGHGYSADRVIDIMPAGEIYPIFDTV